MLGRIRIGLAVGLLAFFPVSRTLAQPPTLPAQPVPVLRAVRRRPRPWPPIKFRR